MTGEEFLTEAADTEAADTMVPAITRVIELAFEAAPRNEVGPLVEMYLDSMTRIAIERVHQILEETAN